MQHQARTRVSRSKQWGLVGVAVLLAALLAGARLDLHPLWDDEANTAIYARNLLRFDRLTAWDGTNLVCYSDGAIGDDLGAELRVPGLPAYVTAAALRVFGESTWAARLPFVIAGVLSVGLLAVWLRRHLGRRFAWYLPPLLLALSPAFLLYTRNCRYYALGLLFSLLVLVVFAPGRARRRRSSGSPLAGRAWARYVAASVAMWLLLETHYLNAAALLAVLPLLFLDRRYRQPQQYVLMAVLVIVTGLFGLWVLGTANPLAADYQATHDWLFDHPVPPGRWQQIFINLWWYLRDLGTHEFLPWAVLPVLLLPAVWPLAAGVLSAVRRWAVRPMGSRADGQVVPNPVHAGRRRGKPGRMPPGSTPGNPAPRRRYACSLAWRGAILLLMTLGYITVAAILLPSDMGKGPTAEMRYIVPILVFGAAISGIALAILWQLARPLAPVAFLLLVCTNWPYLPNTALRCDGTSAWWPPTLYRYVDELCSGYQTGNEAMIDLLRRMPKGISVRTWPPYMVYPPMFYLPELHYCDQLTGQKPLAEPFRGRMPDYLYLERARPDLVFVPAPFLKGAIDVLEDRCGEGSYLVKKVLRPHWNYTSKPEIPAHFFRPPEESWLNYPGMALLAAKGSAVADHPSLANDPRDEESLVNLGRTLAAAGKFLAVEDTFRALLRVKPASATGHYELGCVLSSLEKRDEAIEHFHEAIRLDDRYLEAYLDLGLTLERQGKTDQARAKYDEALAINPNSPAAHFNLANLLLAQDQPKAAEEHYLAALAAEPAHARARVNWGALLETQGRIGEALDQYQYAVRLAPNLVQARLNLARLLMERGDRHGAAEHLDAALDLVPPDSSLAEQIREMLRRARP